MDGTEQTKQFEKASRAIAEGEAQIERQRDLIARLKQAGEDTSEANALLDTLVKRQAERLQSLGSIMRWFPSKGS